MMFCLSESDEEFTPQGDASETEDNNEVNSEECDTGSEKSDGDYDEYECRRTLLFQEH